jgi:gamma-glutamylcyclotransferase (GGCT)/AIG2-like uncharacterized protein YtfP
MTPGPSHENAPAGSSRARSVLLAVNGTLMRGLELNPTLLALGGEYVRDTTTEPSYRLWSIDDRYPAMVRVASGGAAVAVEVWSVQAEGVTLILENEPDGLTIGKVRLADGSVVLGVLGEMAACENQQEITAFRGWRAYIASLTGQTLPP